MTLNNIFTQKKLTECLNLTCTNTIKMFYLKTILNDRKLDGIKIESLVV